MGCKSSKDTIDPVAAPVLEQSPSKMERLNLELHCSPIKKELSQIESVSLKNVSDKQLIDIYEYVKKGDVSMVNAILKKFKIQDASSLFGLEEDYDLSIGGRTETVSMSTWNPLLVAIAYNQQDVVNFFLN